MEIYWIVLYNTPISLIQLCGMRGGTSTLCSTEAAKTNTLLTVRRLTMDMIKVSATSRTSAVAGAIAGVVREHHRAEVQAIGAGAINQAMKALILATGYLKNDGIFVTCVPEFADVTIEDKVRTAIKLVIEPTPDSNFSSVRVSTHSMRQDLAQV
jgi:stage V sporulation protein S